MDLISRQDAIEAVTKYCTEYDLRDLLADLEVLPSAQKTGKWIPQGKDIECGSCGAIYKKYVHPVCGIYKHCPNCGARMECEKE